MTDATDGGSQIPATSHKIVNTSIDAEAGSLLVYFDDAAIGSLEQAAEAAAKTRSVATRAGIVSVDEILSELNVSSLNRLFPVDTRNEERTRAAGLHKWYELQFDTEVDLDLAAQKLSAVAEVANIQFNTKLEKMWDGKATPLRSDAPAMSADTRSIVWPFNDPELKRQWHYINKGDKAVAQTAREGADINVEEAWKLTAGDPKIIVAVVDEGVKYTHPDLAANMWVNTREMTGTTGVDDDGNGYVDDYYGYNFVTNGPISWDVVDAKGDGDSGHGTHTAGTVAAVNNNGIGVCGVAGGSGNNDGVRIMSCQALSGTAAGSGTTAVMARAFKYAADNGASIIQCSMGIKLSLIHISEMCIRDRYQGRWLHLRRPVRQKCQSGARRTRLFHRHVELRRDRRRSGHLLGRQRRTRPCRVPRGVPRLYFGNLVLARLPACKLHQLRPRL